MSHQKDDAVTASSFFYARDEITEKTHVIIQYRFDFTVLNNALTSSTARHYYTR